MTDLRCANPSCRIPRRHAPDCTDQSACGGCLPGVAAPGYRLCWHHVDAVEPDAMRAAVLHGELALALVSKGEPVRGGVPGGISISDAALEARTLIRHTLVSWTLLISEERGVQLPGSYRFVRLPIGVEGPLNRAWRTNDSAIGLAKYLGTHAAWLAAHGAAGDVSGELADMVRAGQRAAYPDGARIIHIGLCPAETDGLPCGGKIRALLRRVDSLLPSAVACDRDESHAWHADQWRALGRHLDMRRAA